MLSSDIACGMQIGEASAFGYFDPEFRWQLHFLDSGGVSYVPKRSSIRSGFPYIGIGPIDFRSRFNTVLPT